MRGGTGGDEASVLLDALDESRSDPTLLRTIAFLWSWLDRHLLALGSLREKPPRIFHSALERHRRGEGFDGEITDATLERIASEPLRNAAELLASIGLHLGPPGKGFAEPTVDIDGRKVVVVWRNPALAVKAHERWKPPAAEEHPSLVTLAPLLNVCPVQTRGIKLTIADSESLDWRSALVLIEPSLSELPYTFNVHLDPLCDHGMSGWNPDKENMVGSFDSDAIDADDEERCADAVRAALGNAAGDATVLMMPELSASERVHDEMRSQLLKLPIADRPPLTISGLYHRPYEGDQDLCATLIRDAPLACHINEAIVMAPNGAELLRHRKLSCAAGRPAEAALEFGANTSDDDDDEDFWSQIDTPDEYVEDIVLGTELIVVATPMGMMALLICLDSFAPHVRERVMSSPADVLFVPSLSPTVRRHRTSIEHLVQSLWGIAFVCNRAYAPTDDEPSVWNGGTNRSFWAVQRERATVPPAARDDEHPSFVFRLAEHEQPVPDGPGAVAGEGINDPE